jgi:hypothetical protein
LTSPYVAHLFLEEKYAIGQMFRKLEKLPTFELVAVGLGVPGDIAREEGMPPRESSTDRVKQQQLWRRYKLIVPDFECDILEVFPSRDMFIRGENWLDDKQNGKELHDAPLYDGLDVSTVSKWPAGVAPFLGLLFLLMLALQFSILFAGSWSF